jgi:hypothetical protein
MNYLLWLALKHDPSDLCLLSSYDFSLQPLTHGWDIYASLQFISSYIPLWSNKIKEIISFFLYFSKTYTMIYDLFWRKFHQLVRRKCILQLFTWNKLQIPVKLFKLLQVTFELVSFVWMICVLMSVLFKSLTILF